MTKENQFKLYCCAHGIYLNEYCFMCDFQSKATTPAKKTERQLKLDGTNIPPVIVEYRDKGPVPKSHMEGCIVRLRPDHEGYMFLNTPKGVAYSLDNYAIVPIEDWLALDRPLIRFIIRVLNSFKKVPVFGKIRRR